MGYVTGGGTSGGSGAVSSVAGRTGDVVLAEADIARLTTDLTAAAFQTGVHSYCNGGLPGLASGSNTVSSNNAGRTARVFMRETGVLHDVACLINTSSGNVNLLIFDAGNSAATHTTRTVLAAKGSTACPAGNAWFTYDPSLAVTAGDVLEFCFSADNTTAKMANYTGTTGTGTWPTTSFLAASGAGTTNQQMSANPGSVFALTAGGTIVTGSWTASDILPMFVWRIAAS